MSAKPPTLFIPSENSFAEWLKTAQRDKDRQKQRNKEEILCQLETWLHDKQKEQEQILVKDVLNKIASLK